MPAWQTQICNKMPFIAYSPSHHALPMAYLQAYRNTVSVPRHWSQKRKYLQGKRGIEKPPFKLPDFIEATGITEMRTTYQEKEDSKKMKAKLRDRMAPKMGKMDIDYQVCFDGVVMAWCRTRSMSGSHACCQSLHTCR